jgi:hypothetical protein
MVAPRGAAERLTSLDAVERGREDGWLTKSRTVANGDTAVFRLMIPGIAGDVRNESGRDSDAQFRTFLDRPNVTVQLIEEHVSPHRDRRHLLLNGSSAGSVVADPTTDTYYVAADFTTLPPVNESDPDPQETRFDWDTFVPQLTVGNDTLLNSDGIREDDHVGEVVAVQRDGDLRGVDEGVLRPGFAAAPNQTVRGDTTVAPGSTVTVSVTDAPGIETPRNATVRVTQERVDPDRDGRSKFAFAAALTLTGVEPGSEIGLDIGPERGAGWDSPERYRVPVDDPDAGVGLPAEPLDNGSVRVTNATLPEGGFVAVERTGGGPVLGSTGYLEPGTYKRLRIDIGKRGSDDDRYERVDLRVFLATDSDGDRTYFAGADRPYADSMRRVGTAVSPSRANATVLAAPSGFRDRLDSRAAVRRARTQGQLTQTETVAIGDTVVLKLTGPGISEAVASQRGQTATARFESLLGGSNATLSLVETKPGPSLPRQHRYLNETGTTTVVADPANDTYYVAADLTTVPAGYEHDGSFPDPDLEEGQRFAPRFLVRSENRINPGDIAEPNQTGHFTVEQPDARLLFRNDTDERYRVGPAPNQTIAGYTNIAPGSAIRVRLSNGTGSQFPVTESVRVSRTEVSEPYDSGYRFRATLNLTGAAPNSSFDVVLRSKGRPISNKYDGYVDPALGLATATPSPTATHTRTATPTTTVQTDQATTTSPGRAADPTGTTAGDGPGFGASAALAAVVLTLLAAGRDRC